MRTGDRFLGSSIKQKVKNLSHIVARKISAYPFLTAVILCLFFFLTAVIFCDQKYETNDDYCTDSILAGTLTGKPNQYILFSNVLLGYLLKEFYTVIPTISFYFIMLELMGIFSMIFIVWIILKRCRTSVGVLASIICLVCFSDDLFILVQFTKVAAVSIAAGGLLFLETITDKTLPHRKICAAAGAVLFLLGSMLRLECIYCVIPFLLIRFIVLAYKNPVKDILFRFLMCMVLIGSSYALLGINNVIWNAEPDFRNYRELNEYRYHITDVPKPLYNEIRTEMEAIGVSEIDYYMTATWQFTDFSVYTPEKLEKIAGVLNDYNSTKTNTISHAFEEFGYNEYWTYPGVIGIALMCFLLLFTEKKPYFTIIASVVVCASLLLYFAYIGRAIYRVEYSVQFAAFAVMAVSFAGNKRENKMRREVYLFSVFGLMYAVLLYHVRVYIPNLSYKTLSDDSYKQYVEYVFTKEDGYNADRYSIIVSKRRIYEDILNRIDNDTDHIYLVDVLSLVNVNLNYSPWIRPGNGKAISRDHTLGGCLMMQYPDETYWYETNGIDSVDPFRSLVNENVYVIDCYYSELKLAYLREHYYPDACVELVGEDNGCQIWKFYIPAENE